MEDIIALWNKYASGLLIMLATGIIGGIINCVMVESGFTLPHVFKSKQGVKTWSPGFLKNILCGIVASFLAWAFGANELDLKRQAAFCLLAGISGSTAILSYLQKNQLNVEKAKAMEYRNMLLDEFDGEQEEDNEQEG